MARPRIAALRVQQVLQFRDGALKPAVLPVRLAGSWRQLRDFILGKADHAADRVRALRKGTEIRANPVGRDACVGVGRQNRGKWCALPRQAAPGCVHQPSPRGTHVRLPRRKHSFSDMEGYSRVLASPAPRHSRRSIHTVIQQQKDFELPGGKRLPHLVYLRGERIQRPGERVLLIAGRQDHRGAARRVWRRMEQGRRRLEVWNSRQRGAPVWLGLCAETWPLTQGLTAELLRSLLSEDTADIPAVRCAGPDAFRKFATMP